MKKRLKTTDSPNEDINDKDDDGVNKDENNDERKGELFKHVKESKEGDIETLDAATSVSKFSRNIKN